MISADNDERIKISESMLNAERERAERQLFRWEDVFLTDFEQDTLKQALNTARLLQPSLKRIESATLHEHFAARRLLRKLIPDGFYLAKVPGEIAERIIWIKDEHVIVNVDVVTPLEEFLPNVQLTKRLITE